MHDSSRVGTRYCHWASISEKGPSSTKYCIFRSERDHGWIEIESMKNSFNFGVEIDLWLDATSLTSWDFKLYRGNIAGIVTY